MLWSFGDVIGVGLSRERCVVLSTMLESYFWAGDADPGMVVVFGVLLAVVMALSYSGPDSCRWSFLLTDLFGLVAEMS